MATAETAMSPIPMLLLAVVALCQQAAPTAAKVQEDLQTLKKTLDELGKTKPKGTRESAKEEWQSFDEKVRAALRAFADQHRPAQATAEFVAKDGSIQVMLGASGTPENSAGASLNFVAKG